MAHSGIHWIDVIYNWCIHLLVDSAKILGITYEEINVWLFVIAWPGGHALALYTGKQ